MVAVVSAVSYPKKELVAFCQLAHLDSVGTRDTLISRIKSYLRRFTYPKRYYPSDIPRWIKKMELRRAELQERTNVHRRSTDLCRSTDLYRPTDIDRQAGPPKRSSRYTSQWKKRYPGVTSLTAIAHLTGIPLDILQTVYDKGLAAWRGGHHRPGASQHAWAMARIYSFVLKGKTHRFPDHLLVKEAKQRSTKARTFWKTLSGGQ